VLSIIIVNYYSESLVKDCLQTIYQQPGNNELEILIVSNGSSEQGKEQVLQQYPAVSWIEMSYNSGFSRANNEGIRQSKGETVLLMNPDVLVEGNAINESYASLIASEYIGCGVQLLNPDRSPQISGNYFMKGGLNHLLPLPVLGKLFRWLGNQLKVKKTNVPEAKGIVEVDWVNGAYLMVRKSAIEKAGLLDEDFFLYAEEIEWCSRLRRIGKFCIYGNLHVVHLQGEVANESFSSSGKGYYNLFDKKGKQLMISNFVRIRKQFGVGWFLFHLLCFVIEIPLFFVLSVMNTVAGGKKGYSLDQFSGYVNNLLFILGKTPGIISNKPYFYKVL
jgi:GT2 family glycosyltransferase